MCPCLPASGRGERARSQSTRVEAGAKGDAKEKVSRDLARPLPKEETHIILLRRQRMDELA